MANPPIIALTPGEPAGVGPDLAIQLAQRPLACALVLIADPDLLAQRAKELRLPFSARDWHGRKSAAAGMYVRPVKAARPVTAGKLDRANAPYVIETLKAAVAGCTGGEFDALVTGPVHKGILNDAGIAFTGHTEFLAEASGTAQPVMLLAAPGLRVALVTTHLPLAEIPRAITHERLTKVLEVLHADLKNKFGIADPVILVCGLNPHAGESGHLGREEIEVIEPAIKALSAKGMRLRGPVPADTAFIPSQLQGVDTVLAMYHDQGLPVLKHHDFAHAVNVTLGLPFVRTSVDHGTALELAGTGRADVSSLVAATETALKIVETADKRRSNSTASLFRSYICVYLRSSAVPEIIMTFRARKRFGQHFLHDRHVIGRIVAALAPRPGDHIVEIGPGKGALTRELATQLSHFDAVELDRDLLAHLQAVIPAGKLTLHSADALKFDFCQLMQQGHKLRLVGNLPYNISTPLLFHLLDQAGCIADMLFMLQKEVVDRLSATPGGKDYGRLSVMIQYRCRVEKLFDVAPGAFTPPPKVDSAVVRLIPYATPPVAVNDEVQFAKVVRAAFASRRKTLRNNMKGLLSAEAMTALGIDPTRRAETLSLAEFAALSNAISLPPT